MHNNKQRVDFYHDFLATGKEFEAMNYLQTDAGSDGQNIVNNATRPINVN